MGGESVRRVIFRRPAECVLTLLLIGGCARAWWMLAGPASENPGAALVAIVLFTAYAVPFFLFIASVDALEPEPKPLVAAAFGWGGFVTVALVEPVNTALVSHLADITSPAFAQTWGPALIAPTVEEPVKALGIIMIALTAGQQINSLVDGLVYGALVGLGFQVVEDIFYAIDAVNHQTSGHPLEPVFETFVRRGFLSGPWSHTVFTALAGAGIAHGLLCPSRRRYVVPLTALGGAWLCHFTWNCPLLSDGLGILVELLVKGIPPLLLVLAIVKTAVYREAEQYIERLQLLGDPGVATPMELRALRSHAGRVQAQRDAMAAVGRPTMNRPRVAARQYRHAWRCRQATRRLQRAQSRLAVALSRNGDTRAVVTRAYAEVLAARARLNALRDWRVHD